VVVHQLDADLDLLGVEEACGFEDASNALAVGFSDGFAEGEARGVRGWHRHLACGGLSHAREDGGVGGRLDAWLARQGPRGAPHVGHDACDGALVAQAGPRHGRRVASVGGEAGVGVGLEDAGLAGGVETEVHPRVAA